MNLNPFAQVDKRGAGQDAYPPKVDNWPVFFKPFPKKIGHDPINPSSPGREGRSAP